MNDFARVLILETSGKIGQVAVARDGCVVGVRMLSEARRHARDMAARSAELLAEQGWKARELTAVVVSIGPGSYTGLRVGIASANALAFATGAALFGVPTFDAITIGIKDVASTLEIIADAQQGQVYCQRFQTDTAGVWKPADKIGIRAFEEWKRDLIPDSIIAGPAAANRADRLPETVRLAEAEQRHSQAENLLIAAKGSDCCYRSNAWETEPIYLRGSSAEEKRMHDSDDSLKKA
jgi:tRNA threonylcarbamoyladenosine biosynthesis protein TsaB